MTPERFIHIVTIIITLLTFGLPVSLSCHKKASLLENILLSFPYAVMVIAFTGVLLTIFYLPINAHTVLSLLVFFIFLNIFLLKKYYKLKRKEVGRRIVLISILTLLFLLSRIIPIFSSNVPPLHDPVNHSLYTKEIITSSKINYFYSPGLHLVTAFIEFIHPHSIPFTVSFVTNFFNGYIFLTLSYYFYKKHKNLLLGILSGSLITLAKYPTSLFYLAGKNSLITAASTLPILFLMFEERNRSFSQSIITGLVLFCIALLHYPTAAFGATYLVAYTLSQLWLKKKTALSKKIIKNSAVIGIVSLTALLIFISPRIASENKRIQNTVDVTKIIPPRESLSMKSVGQDTLKIIEEVVAYHHFSILIISTFFFSIIIQIYRKDFVLPFWTILSILFFVSIRSLRLPYLRMVTNTGIILTSVFVFTNISNLIRLIPYKNKILNSIFMLGIIVFFSYQNFLIFNEFKAKQKHLDIVTKNDLSAFEWISKNLSPKTIILNNAIINDQIATIVYPTDGGMWIPVFTDSDVAMSFFKSSDKKTHETYTQYKILKRDPDDKNALSYLKKNNIDFLFLGDKPIYGTPLNSNLLEQSENYSLVYKIGNSMLFKINYEE